MYKLIGLSGTVCFMLVLSLLVYGINTDSTHVAKEKLGVDARIGLQDSNVDTRHQRHEKDVKDHSSCQSVKDKFASVTHLGPIPDTKRIDPEIGICSNAIGHLTCCTHQMELRFQHLAQEEVRDIAQSTSADLRSTVIFNAELFEGEFRQMVSSALNETLVVISNMFGLTDFDQRLLRKLARIMEDYLTQSHNVDTSLVQGDASRCVDRLFVAAFRHYALTPSVERDIFYDECIAGMQADMTPASPLLHVRHSLEDGLRHAAVNARAFLSAVRLAVQTINATGTIIAGEDHHQCWRAMARMSRCAMCTEEAPILACRPLCINVMRGCSAFTMTAVSTRWQAFIGSLHSLVSAMSGASASHDITDIARSFAFRVSEALRETVDNMAEYRTQVFVRCGLPKGMNLTTSTPIVQVKLPGRRNPTAHRSGLHKQIRTFMSNLEASRTFFQIVPDLVCNSRKLTPAAAKDACWNGAAVGQYTKKVPRFTTAEQMKDNPEMRVPEAITPFVTDLMTKLDTLTKHLSSLARTEDRPQADDAEIDASDVGSGMSRGSGHGRYPTDDEDWEESGSGSGDPKTGTAEPRSDISPISKTDFTFQDGNSTSQSPYVTTRATTITKPKSIATQSAIATKVPIFVAIVTTVWWTFVNHVL